MGFNEPPQLYSMEETLKEGSFLYIKVVLSLSFHCSGAQGWQVVLSQQ